MSQEVLQMVIDYVFGTVFIYLAPILLVIAIVLFSDEIIKLIHRTLGSSNGRY
ncbi:hypothetical protein [Alkalibacillus haloalkaliphilus]|uniref:hypothetical protein n=1 Tax=Alkalibacillus haloalkaliphilus TaxID=94136 RepID=UPI00037F7FE1|nr:hypothetical protein [Alkalibacillus haloalkaliphilus]